VFSGVRGHGREQLEGFWHFALTWLKIDAGFGEESK
jgi:hypothetical protein